MDVKKNTPVKITKKKKKKKITLLRIFKITSLTILSIMILSAVAACGVALAIIKTTPALDVNAVLSLNEPSTLYDSTGKYMDDVATDEKRTVIELKDMPVLLQNAFISIEDERFRTHIGIDPRRILGSVFFDIKSKLKGEKLLQGGSTLTQQLVSNTILNKKVTIQRKVQEMYLAVELEKHLSKDLILQAYMNTIFLGGSANGVEAAANQYFNKSAKDLTLIECAFIGGLAQNPSGSYANVLTDVRNSSVAAKAAEDAKLADEAAKTAANTTRKSATQIKNEAAAAQKAADTAKASADTAKKMATAAVKAHNSYISRTETVLYKMYDTNHITKAQYDAAIADIKAGKLQFSLQSASSKDKLNYEWFSLPAIEQVKKDLKTQYNYDDKQINSLLMYGGLKIYTTMDKNLQDTAQTIINNNDNYNGNDTSKNGIPVLQSSAVITDYHTGEVKVIIGGRGDQPARSYNRAAYNGSKEFLRPTGSAIKPLAVYSPAIDTKQATAATIIEDTPLPTDIGIKYPDNGKPYNPKDDDGNFLGPITIREAIMKSRNLVAVKLEDQIGLKTGRDYAKRFGITTVSDKDSIAAMALGQLNTGTNTLTMAAAYGVFGNSGIYTAPKLYTKVVDRNGKIILETKTTNTKVISPQAAFIMYDLLKGPTTSSGTAPSAPFSDMPVAGKTGTASNLKDLWFCGLTPYYSGAVWIGNDNNEVISGLNSNNAAAIWSQIMEAAHKNLAVKDISQPSGIDNAVVCSVSGKIPTDACSKDSNGKVPHADLFISGTEPTTNCDVHIQVNVNKSNGKIATDNTPKDQIETRYYSKYDSNIPTAADDTKPTPTPTPTPSVTPSVTAKPTTTPKQADNPLPTGTQTPAETQTATPAQTQVPAQAQSPGK